MYSVRLEQLCEISKNLIICTEFWLTGNIFAKVNSLYEHNKCPQESNVIAWKKQALSLNE